MIFRTVCRMGTISSTCAIRRCSIVSSSPCIPCITGKVIIGITGRNRTRIRTRIRTRAQTAPGTKAGTRIRTIRIGSHSITGISETAIQRSVVIVDFTTSRNHLLTIILWPNGASNRIDRTRTDWGIEIARNDRSRYHVGTRLPEKREEHSDAGGCYQGEER